MLLCILTDSCQGADPLQLGRPAGWQPQQGSHKRKSRVSGNFTRGIRSLIEGSPVSPSDTGPSYNHLVQTTNEHKTSPRRRPEAPRNDSNGGWDVVDELPLRWATDYVPLASAGSRLANTSVLTFAVWRDLNHPRGNALLAVATKSSVLLYESPKGERAFRFLKASLTHRLSRSRTDIPQGLLHACLPTGYQIRAAASIRGLRVT